MFSLIDNSIYLCGMPALQSVFDSLQNEQNAFELHAYYACIYIA